MNRTKRIVAAILAIAMCAVLFAGCGTKTESAKTGVEDGVLTVAMECAYAPTTGLRAMIPTALSR